MNQELKQSLKQMKLFDNIKPSSLNTLIAKSHQQCYPAGNTIFLDKDELSCIYIVLSGTASLYKSNENGQNKVIFILGKGELLNEMIFEDLPSAINCKAYSNCTLLTIYKKDLLPLMAQDFVLTQNLMNSLSRKIRRLYRQLKNSSSVIKIEKKLAAKLWKLGTDYGKPCPEGIMIDFPITITALADFLGSYRETVSRALKVLIEKKLVTYQSKTIIIMDMDALSTFFKTS